MEDDYWSEHHKDAPYYEEGMTYQDDYRPAYRYGWESRARHAGTEFSDVEPRMRNDWATARAKSRLEWEKARDAVRDAWDRAGAERETDACRRRAKGCAPSGATSNEDLAIPLWRLVDRQSGILSFHGPSGPTAARKANLSEGRGERLPWFRHLMAGLVAHYWLSICKRPRRTLAPARRNRENYHLDPSGERNGTRSSSGGPSGCPGIAQGWAQGFDPRSPRRPQETDLRIDAAQAGLVFNLMETFGETSWVRSASPACSICWAPLIPAAARASTTFKRTRP